MKTFTAPRPSKPVETVHRKDNSEWGKRMERQLAQIEKRQTSIETKQDSDDDNEPIVHHIPTYLKMLSEREADETAKFGEVQRWNSDSEGDEVPISQTLMQALKEPKESSAVTVTETEGEFT